MLHLMVFGGMLKLRQQSFPLDKPDGFSRGGSTEIWLPAATSNEKARYESKADLGLATARHAWKARKQMPSAEN
jgi:hypothetical protein